MANKHQLHALLAVEGDLKSQAEKLMNETKDIFDRKLDHFVSFDRVYSKIDDDGLDYPNEHKAMVTTVDSKLAYVNRFVMRVLDCVFQKEKTNTLAKADLKVDGEILAVDIPATVLLNFESRLKAIRALYASIPTLSPGEKWLIDKDAEKGVYKAGDKITFKTEKRVVPIVLYEATKEHPAQVKESSKDIVIGKYLTETRCSCWPVAKKTQALENIDKLIAACKKARQKANNVEASTETIAKKLFDYIHKDLSDS